MYQTYSKETLVIPIDPRNPTPIWERYFAIVCVILPLYSSAGRIRPLKDSIAYQTIDINQHNSLNLARDMGDFLPLSRHILSHFSRRVGHCCGLHPQLWSFGSFRRSRIVFWVAGSTFFEVTKPGCSTKDLCLT
jgi:hypothetical protein